jgi:hypothetical protein
MPTQSNTKKNSNEEEYAEDNRVVEPKEVVSYCIVETAARIILLCASAFIRLVRC